MKLNGTHANARCGGSDAPRITHAQCSCGKVTEGTNDILGSQKKTKKLWQYHSSDDRESKNERPAQYLRGGERCALYETIWTANSRKTLEAYPFIITEYESCISTITTATVVS